MMRDKRTNKTLYELPLHKLRIGGQYLVLEIYCSLPVCNIGAEYAGEALELFFSCMQKTIHLRSLSNQNIESIPPDDRLHRTLVFQHKGFLKSDELEFSEVERWIREDRPKSFRPQALFILVNGIRDEHTPIITALKLIGLKYNLATQFIHLNTLKTHGEFVIGSCFLSVKKKVPTFNVARHWENALRLEKMTSGKVSLVVGMGLYPTEETKQSGKHVLVLSASLNGMQSTYRPVVNISQMTSLKIIDTKNHTTGVSLHLTEGFRKLLAKLKCIAKIAPTEFLIYRMACPSLLQRDNDFPEKEISQIRDALECPDGTFDWMEQDEETCLVISKCPRLEAFWFNVKRNLEKLKQQREERCLQIRWEKTALKKENNNWTSWKLLSVMKTETDEFVFVSTVPEEYVNDQQTNRQVEIRYHSTSAPKLLPLLRLSFKEQSPMSFSFVGIHAQVLSEEVLNSLHVGKSLSEAREETKSDSFKATDKDEKNDDDDSASGNLNIFMVSSRKADIPPTMFEILHYDESVISTKAIREFSHRHATVYRDDDFCCPSIATQAGRLARKCVCHYLEFLYEGDTAAINETPIFDTWLGL